MFGIKSGAAIVEMKSTPRSVRDVLGQMAIVRMFSNFIRWMHRGT
jgi:hypothetical protein